MKQKTKDIIVGVSSTALTIGVSTMAGWAAGAGTFKLMNDLMVGGMTRGQLKLYTGVITVGSIGVGYLVADSVYPKLTGFMQDVMDVFPTEPKEVNDADT